jgi:NADP-dependent 3-hydroxy acid dehydrogenase YdfG
MVNISSVAGRMTRKRAAASNLTKHGVGAFSDALRQEVTLRHVRVSLVEPGAVETELTGGGWDVAKRCVVAGLQRPSVIG